MNWLMRFLVLVLPFVLAGCPSTPPPKTVNLGLDTMRVGDTDPDIQYKPNASHVYVDCTTQVCEPVLFVFLPGTNGLPQNHEYILQAMADTGIRVLGLAYQNNKSIIQLCGNDDACYTQSRMDRLFGAVSSRYVDSEADGVENRLLKALQYLQWTDFYEGDTLIQERIIYGGFSQGAGMAAMMGKHRLVQRVCMFSGPWDNINGSVSASWLSEASVTPAEQFYGFSHMHDSLTNGVYYLDQNWQSLGMGSADVQLYTNLQGQKLYADETGKPCSRSYHACSVQDENTPLDQDELPLYQEAWRYVCGRPG